MTLVPTQCATTCNGEMYECVVLGVYMLDVCVQYCYDSVFAFCVEDITWYHQVRVGLQTFQS